MKTFVIAAALACGAFPAFAADAVVELPPVEMQPVFSWTGGYVGVQGGYLWGDSHIDVLSAGDYADPQPAGFLGGIYGGYNYQLPSNLVVGIDVDIVKADATAFGQGYFQNGTPAPAGSGFNAESKWSGAVRGRLGYAAGRFLPYVAGGVAFTDLDYFLYPQRIAADTQAMIGWTVGAGVEYALTDNLIGRFEYRYSDFGSDNFELLGISDKVDYTTSEVRFGLAYKF